MDVTSTTSQVQFPAVGSPAGAGKLFIALEILAVFTCILFYIWRWQYSHPWFWIPMLIFVIASHLIRHDSLQNLGLAHQGLRDSAKIVFPLAALVLLPALVYGLASGNFHPGIDDWPALRYFGAYLVWCVFQQYLMQSYFHNRIMRIVENRHISSAMTALMFGAAHIPNPVLMAVTTLGGFFLSEVYARHRNIWPLALVQALCGVTLAALVPAALIHNMRVGPGYFLNRQI